MIIRDALSGEFGAVCLVAVGAPFDKTKLRMQTHSVRVPAGGIATPRPPSAFGVMASVVRSEGVISLWKGASPGKKYLIRCVIGLYMYLALLFIALASALIENIVVFGVNGSLRRLVGGDMVMHHDLSFGAHAAIGAASGIFSSIAICPTEVNQSLCAVTCIDPVLV